MTSWIVPPALEDAVYAATTAALGAPALQPSALARAIVDRSKRYTSERDRLSAPADVVGDLAARAAFFTIADAIKIAIPLGELAGRGALPAGRPTRIVDVGAGCGAMSLGVIASAQATALAPLELLLIDQDARALAIAADALRRLAAARGIAATVTTRVADATTAALPPAELVVIGTLLNELAPAAQLAIVTRAIAASVGDGAVIVVEPALRDTARALHELRDRVLTAQLAAVFAPCTRAAAPCPALRDPDDWCHEHRAVSLPPRTAALARTTHLRDGGLKLAYLVLRHAHVPLVDAAATLPTALAPAPSPTAWRVVSAPMPAKGKLELIGCSDRGRATLRLLRRHRADGNRSFERADRGDVLVIAAEPEGDAEAVTARVEITADTPLARVTPASPSPHPRGRSSP